MDWKAIQKNITNVVDAVQTVKDKVSVIADTTQKGLSSLKGASEILNGEGDLFTKGSKLISLAGSIINDQQVRSLANIDKTTDETVKSTSDGSVSGEISIPEEYEILEGEEATCEDTLTESIPIESPVEAVKAIAAMGTEIAKAIQICQIEETKRTEIKAHMEVEVTRINAISKLLSDYLDKTFDERADLFDNYFRVLDRAIESGDTALMSATLGSINSLAAQSPFRNLADFSAVQQQLSQASTEWDI